MPPLPGRLASQPPTKTIIVYRNGDAFFPGRKLVVKQRQVTTFDSLLTLLTSGLEASFGAVRNVYTPREGHKVSELEELRTGERYVAAGAERFKRLSYLLITPRKPEPKKKEEIKPVTHSRIVVPARCLRSNKDSCTINVFTNGDVFVPPARILIPKFTLSSWEKVLALVTEKVELRTGAVHGLFSLEGRPLRGPEDLRSHQYYVAVGAERFRVKAYSQWFAAAGFREDLEHTARGRMKQPSAAGRPTQPNNTQVATDPLLLSVGEGSAFRGRSQREEVAGAVEVQEESELEVELPIDQVEAREVEEESVQRGIEPSGISEGLQGRRLPGRWPMGVSGRDIGTAVFHNAIIQRAVTVMIFSEDSHSVLL
ncbi:doublecortin domain-containing protein 2C [Gadus chalcogrammus]|uniref:doublecortin domain-containing protein 2C n=1 Tax=Gadus chalcogrammus TaxID=1042646 RepID=UPI0024C34348|nr:doublecortin domain-containing protein 2C [Gadus chalcogrammus]